jgi:hypothetical protein
MSQATFRIGSLRRALLLAVRIVVVAVFPALPAWAGVGGAAGPTWPATLKVGDPVSAYIDIFNVSNGVNASESVDILQVTFTPSCAAQTVGSCTTPDLGVFMLGPTGVGDPTSSCNNAIFTFVGPDAMGVYTLNPSRPIHLGPADGSGGASNPSRCRIVINAMVARMPIDSTPPSPPVTTFQFAHAVMRGQTSKSGGAAVGQATIDITPSVVVDLSITLTNGVSVIQSTSRTK